MKPSESRSLIEPLTQRELDVVRLLAEGLSNREIADQLVIGLETVRWYAKQIYSKLDVHSREEAGERAKALGLLDEPDARSADDAVTRHHNFPTQLTSFVGRKREIAAIREQLATTRLLTLTGVGGTGKTRLSLQIGLEVAQQFPHGAGFVGLATITDPASVATAIAEALDIRESAREPLLDTLRRALRDKRLLLILDNFEHVLAGAAIVPELLKAAPGIKILATSREALRVSGEQVYPVPPLQIPAVEKLGDLETLSQVEAISLFVQRAQAIKPGFRLDESNAADIATLSRRLDGLPLALELAAARSNLLSPGAMVQRLDRRFRVLTGGSRDAPERHQTLRAAIDWSYSLLDEAEQQLFARLAVFRGGCSLVAIETVCGDGLPLDVLDGMASLVAKSLVQLEEDFSGEPRFIFLETIHEYAWERLEASGEAEALRKRHAAYFVELAERAEPELRRAGQDYWFPRLEAEHDNIRAALQWSLLSGDGEAGLRLVAALRDFWFYQGHHIAGQRWADYAFEYLEDVSPGLRAGVLSTAASLASARQQSQQSKSFSLQALTLFRELGEKRHAALELVYLAQVSYDASAQEQDDFEEAMALCEEGLALLREHDDGPGIAQALNVMGNLLRVSGDLERANAIYEECLAISRQTGEKRRVSMSLANMGILALRAGDYQQAERLFRDALVLSWELNFNYMVVTDLSKLAGALAAKGQSKRGARLLGAVAAAQDSMGIVHQPNDQPDIDFVEGLVRAQLDEATFRAAWDEGRQMTLDQAVAEALAETSDPDDDSVDV